MTAYTDIEESDYSGEFLNSIWSGLLSWFSTLQWRNFKVQIDVQNEVKSSYMNTAVMAHLFYQVKLEWCKGELSKVFEQFTKAVQAENN